MTTAATEQATPTMNAPNLFDFATGELSQDAFVCWLAAWADPGCREANGLAAYNKHGALLETQGITLTEGRPGPRRPGLSRKTAVFVDMERVKKYLLRASSWQADECEEIILAVPGAMRQQRVAGKRRVWGVEIPM